MRPLIKWAGGKGRQHQWIIPLLKIGQEGTYFELCGGAGSILCNMPKSNLEYWNDLNIDLYNLFFIVKNRSHELIHKLLDIQYTKEQFEFSKNYKFNIDEPLESAVNFYIKCRMSVIGRGQSFSYSKDRFRGGQVGEVNAWCTSIHNIKTVSERFRDVILTNLDVIDFLAIFGFHNNDLVYIDPPYVRSTRTCDLYQHEMTDEQHILLSEKLKSLKCHVAVSGYPSELYNKLYKGWNFHKKEVNLDSAFKSKDKIDFLGAKRNRIELLICNY